MVKSADAPARPCLVRLHSHGQARGRRSEIYEVPLEHDARPVCVAAFLAAPNGAQRRNGSGCETGLAGGKHQTPALAVWQPAINALEQTGCKRPARGGGKVSAVNAIPRGPWLRGPGRECHPRLQNWGIENGTALLGCSFPFAPKRTKPPSSCQWQTVPGPGRGCLAASNASVWQEQHGSISNRREGENPTLIGAPQATSAKTRTAARGRPHNGWRI
jgi:hypothetical protein